MLPFLLFTKIERPKAFDPIHETNKKEICPVRIDDPGITWDWIKALYPNIHLKDIKKYNGLGGKQTIELQGLLPLLIPVPCQERIQHSLLQTNPVFDNTILQANGSLVLSLCYVARDSLSGKQCLDKVEELQSEDLIDQYGHAKVDLPYFNKSFNIGLVPGIKKHDNQYEYTICRSKSVPYRYIVNVQETRRDWDKFSPSLVDGKKFSDCWGVTYPDY